MKLRENPEIKPCLNGRRSVVCLNPKCHYVQSNNTTHCPRCGGTWMCVTRTPVPSRKRTTRFKAFLRMVSRTQAHWQGDKEYGWAQRYNYGRHRPVTVKSLPKHELEYIPRQLKPRHRTPEYQAGRVVPGAREMILEGLEDI